MKFRFFFASSAALALAACGGAEDEAVTEDLSADTELATDTATPTTAQEFASTVAASDAYEIEAGGLAQEQGTSQEVKDFGAMMVMDHTTSTTNLQTAAGQAEGVTVAPQMTAEQQANLDALRNAGENFDSTYIQQQVQAHEQALSVLRNYADNGDTPALQDFASQTAEVVQGHLEQAQQLQTQTEQP